MFIYFTFNILEPIAGSAGQDHETEEVSFDESDLAALREFLGPEVILITVFSWFFSTLF